MGGDGGPGGHSPAVMHDHFPRKYARCGTTIYDTLDRNPFITPSRILPFFRPLSLSNGQVRVGGGLRERPT